MKEKTFYLVFFLLVLTVISSLVFVVVNKPREAYTELYFTNFRELPKTMEVGNEYWFAFTVVSHENAVTNYSYSVSSQIHNEKRDFSLDLGMNKTIFITFTPNRKIDSSQMVVELFTGKQNQSIHFWYSVN